MEIVLDPFAEYFFRFSFTKNIPEINFQIENLLNLNFFLNRNKNYTKQNKAKQITPKCSCLKGKGKQETKPSRGEMMRRGKKKNKIPNEKSKNNS